MGRGRMDILTKLCLASAAVLAICQGCIYDSLEECPQTTYMLKINYNWDSVGMPRIPASAMAVLLYPRDHGGYWRYDLNHQGGKVPVPSEVFRTITYNENLETARVTYHKDYDSVRAVSLPGQLLFCFPKNLVKEEPPAPKPDEPVYMCPTQIVAEASDWFTYTLQDTTQILYPALFTPIYTVSVDSVENIESASAVAVALTGMSRGKFIASGQRIASPVTNTASMTADPAAKTLSSRFNTFGPAPDAKECKLCVYAVLVDGKRQIYSFDVTRQVLDAPDPMHVNIRVSGIELPEAEPSGEVGTVDVGVSSWEIVNITISNN